VTVLLYKSFLIMAETLATCGDGCGWVAGVVAAMAFGTFGVPLKMTNHIDVHPLVLQTFKTLTMFCLSWCVIFLGIRPRFTYWGLVSGFLWVVGGTGGIFAIRMAGLAIAVGTWASCMVLVNFLWGFVVFHEPINNIKATILAFLLLTMGLIGMSIYAVPRQLKKRESEVELEQPIVAPLSNPSAASDVAEEGASSYTNIDQSHDSVHESSFDICGFKLTKRQAGIAGAIFNGFMTGSSLIPMHYAKAQGFGGANYFLSLAGGSVVSNAMLWIAMYLWECIRLLRSSNDSLSSPSPTFPAYETTQLIFRRAYDAMPLWHFSQLTIPGISAGILLSIAMFGSVLSVTYLGQGIGNSIVQTKILVSGLWGIFVFAEIRGTWTIAKWFLSASLSVIGIVWLSYERILATSGEDKND
jgi:glucose uptake protein GlcU